jgi:hypothetical protein
MDGNGFSGQGGLDTALQIAGRGIGGIAALADVWANRNPFGTLEKINAFRQDPGFRQEAGPFAAGLVQVGGGRAPEVGPGMAGNIMQRAGISSGQYVPNFGPLPADVALQQQFAQMQAAALRNATPEQQQQAGLHAFGVTPSMTAEQMAQYQAMSGPQMRVRVPGPGGSQFTFGGGPGAGGISTPFKLWQQEHPKGTFDDFAKAQASAAGQKTAATVAERPLSAPVEQELEQLNTIDGLIQQANEALKNPEVQKSVGSLSGRLGMLEYKAGLRSDPAGIDFVTLRELIRVLSIGRLARQAGARNFHVWNELNIHPPQPGDNMATLTTKLKTLQKVVRDTAQNAAKASMTPRGKAETLVPGANAPTPAAPAGGVQTTPGGNTYRILPEP